MSKLMNTLTLSCLKATELMDKYPPVKLSIREKVMLKVHKSMCDACTNYEKQSKFLNELLSKQIFIHSEDNIPTIENRKLREQIISKI